MRRTTRSLDADGPTTCLICTCQRPPSGLRRAEGVPPKPEAVRSCHLKVLLIPQQVEGDNELVLALDDRRRQPQFLRLDGPLNLDS